MKGALVIVDVADMVTSAPTECSLDYQTVTQACVYMCAHGAGTLLHSFHGE